MFHCSRCLSVRVVSAILAGTVGLNLSAKTFADDAKLAASPTTPSVAVSFTAIAVTPTSVAISNPRATQRLVVLGTLADGTAREVAEGIQFASGNLAVASVSADGLVSPAADGTTEVTISVGDRKVSVPVNVHGFANRAIHFGNDILPVISKANCNITGCHGSPQGKKAFKLSLFGAETNPDFQMLSRAAFGSFANRVEPAQSYFLLKATSVIAHGGGKRIQPGSADHKLLIEWVEQGMPLGDEKTPKLVGIEVTPSALRVRSDEKRQLLVTARFADGSTRDVTRLASFKSNEDGVASADDNGRVTMNGNGEAIIVVGYSGQYVTSRVSVPQTLSRPFPEVAPNNRIDELVFAKLQGLGIPPSAVCNDAEFLRRVSLDVIGTLPAPDETRRFLADQDPNKRAKLIDSLLERGEFADYWALKWGDLLRVKPEFPIQLWPKGVATFHRWIRDSIAANKPYDQFVRELITASGSGYRVGPANYFRATSTKDPQSWAEMTATTFLGVRIDCAHCHNHPFESWTWDDNFGFAACFPVGIKGTGEWGEEIVHFQPSRSVRHVQTGQVVKPKLLGGDVLELSPDEDPRVKLADWMTSPSNRWFTRNIANRVWYWMLGRGIIHEPDDLRETNPPANPELLEFLTAELIAHKYDLKHLFRLVLNSKTYQLSSKPTPENRNDSAHFSHYSIKRMGAEQLLDAVSYVCESPEKFPGLPAGYRAIQLPHSEVNSYFLDLFGRPPRDISCECERKQEASMSQALYLINTDHLEGKIRDGQRLKRLIKEGKTDAEILDELYLVALSRTPTEAEKSKLLDYVAARKDARELALQDALWAIVNTKEFLFNH